MRNKCNVTRNLRPGRFMKNDDILDLKSKWMLDNVGNQIPDILVAFDKRWSEWIYLGSEGKHHIENIFYKTLICSRVKSRRYMVFRKSARLCLHCGQHSFRLLKCYRCLTSDLDAVFNFSRYQNLRWEAFKKFLKVLHNNIFKMWE